ncbi:ABC transporter transmembrane protein [Frankia sp. Hr75.2]|nr:ABC transporter transmembrane protein [Frankia sp. Hr75.2]
MNPTTPAPRAPLTSTATLAGHVPTNALDGSAPSPSAVTLPAYHDEQRVTWPRVVASEWTKLRSLPSTLWSLLAAVALVVGFGVVYSMVRVARPPVGAADLAGFDPTSVSLAGVQLAQLAIGVLGALMITGEYGTGSIRATFAAVPRRTPVLWAKAVAVAVATLFGTLFALQIVVGLLPEDTADSVNRYLPVPAGSALTLARPDTLSLAPWAGFGLLCGYVAVLLALAARRLRRRDT